ncbi:MAG: ribonucleoside-diphosphate reductase, adenosylcobalamin-dependent [Cyanobacteria bacterium RYN_339]|nr:ribonucleoside-diphosphate reductase, adenosylcobalamin-dependent [Cyanobacteria bacterium RYN_339]
MLSKNAITVLEKRYLLKDMQGKLSETPEGLFERVSNALAEPERKYGADDAEVKRVSKQFFDLTYNLDFLPNSPTLANAGTRTGQLSACFVLPVPDDLAGIFETIKHAALIHQTGGGTGFSFSRLRPKNDLVQSTKGVSSGPISFMDVFNAATESIKQGGMRRGANMGILRIDHPDILDFIAHKEDLSKLTNFNISVAVTDAFMVAVEAGTAYDLLNPRSGEVAGQLDARTVFRQVVQRAWSTGEPGLVFMDRMNRYCPVPWMGGYEATNPCGEQPLIPYESCNLGSINLERFVIGDAGERRIDWERLRGVVHVSTHLLDNVIDANKYPIQEIEDVTHATRKIGLGVMGFARMLFLLGVGYGTSESFAVAEQVMSFIDFESKVKSIELSKKRGPFPGRLGHEAESNAFFARLLLERQEQGNRHPEARFADLIPQIEAHGIRNSTTTTVAPTGTLSIIADTSGGCEPVFALAFKRWQADTHMVDADGVFMDQAKAQGFYSEALMEAIDQNHGTLEGLQGFDIPESATQVFRTAHDISPEEHVRLQAAFQHYNDSATSKTINFSESATAEDVETAYRLAWETGCKGITVYRNNSRQFQPLSVSKKEAPVAEAPAPQPVAAAAPTLRTRPRPEDLYGYTRTTHTGDGKLYTTVNYDEFGIREVVTNIGRSGGTLFSLSEAIGRLISLSLQHNVPVEDVSRSLIGIRGANPYGFGANQVLSIPDAIGKVLKDSPRQLGQVLVAQPTHASVAAAQPVKMGADRFGPDAVHIYGESPECPECGNGLEFGEGCVTCRGCGYSKCG